MGGAALAEAHAADALAVAYETMQRADHNIQTLLSRLRALDHVFAAEPHLPPGRKTWKTIQKLNKAVGAMPLSLRAFYDVVGAVNFIGKHPVLDAPGSHVRAGPAMRLRPR